MAFICLSLMASEVEHLFKQFWPVIFFGEMSIQILYYLKKCVVFLMLSFKSSLHILDISSLSDIWFVNTFCHPMGSLFTFSIASKCFQPGKVQFIYFCCCCCAFSVMSKYPWPNPKLLRFTLESSSKSFTFLLLSSFFSILLFLMLL